jgi:putative acetyltransferase
VKQALSNIIIRPEEESDRIAIHDLTKRAFAPMPYAGGNEQDIVDLLRDRGALRVSLVAVHERDIVGHVAFSDAVAPDGTSGWYALGPVAVEPDLQRRGVGSLLIRSGIERLKLRRAAGCILVGNAAYYSRFGFALSPEHAPSGQPPEHFMVLKFATAAVPQGLMFHPAFDGTTC